MEESKCIIQNDTEEQNTNNEKSRYRPVAYSEKKRMEYEGKVKAGQESTLLSERGKRRMPTTKGYSDESKVYSPVSRSI